MSLSTGRTGGPGCGWPPPVPEVQLPQHATAAEYLAAADAVTGIRIGQRRSEA
jgi:hypothetical protein